MNEFEIFLLVMVLYWSDLITGPILYLHRKYDHWISIREIKKDIDALKKCKKEGKDPIEEGILHEWNPEPYVPPTKFEMIICWIRRNLWRCLLEHPEDLRLWLLCKFQRAHRGWSYRDTWGFYDTLATIIIGGIKHLKKTKHGIPASVCGKGNATDTDEGFARAEKRWDIILDSIIKTFETSKRIGNDNWLYQNSKNYDLKFANKWRKIHKKWLAEDKFLWEEEKLHVMTKKECKEYEKGWKLFQIHFFGLND